MVIRKEREPLGAREPWNGIRHLLALQASSFDAADIPGEGLRGYENLEWLRIVPWDVPCSWYIVVFVVRPSVCFCLQAMCRLVVDDFDGVAGILESFFFLLFFGGLSGLRLGVGVVRGAHSQ